MKIFNYSFILIFTLTFTVLSLGNQADTIKTSSGLKYIVVKKGNRIKAKKGNEVEVHYTGTLLDGTKFDSSRDRNEPITFDVLGGQMIPGFDEGISYMSEGAKFKLIIPYKLGYGKSGSGNIPPKATLIFDVELLKVTDFGISLADTLWKIYELQGIDKTLIEYEMIKANSADKFDLREKQLRDLGNKFLLFGKFTEALKVFELNKSLFPESGYVYDSLGEAYIMQFQTEKALEYYHKALEKDPNITNSKKMIMLLTQEQKSRIDSNQAK